MSAQATEDDTKTVSTLTAQAALAGIQLVRLADGSFMASRWGLTKPLADAQAVRAWMQTVTGKAPAA